MRSINNPDALRREAVRVDVRIIAIALLGYMIITSFATLLIVFITGVLINGIVYLLASLIGFLFLWLLLKDTFYLGDIMEETREIPPKVMRNALVGLLGLQAGFQAIGQGIEEIFALTDQRIEFSTINTTDGGLIFILINTVLIGPIVEEILFRGAVLRVLQTYGRNFAIVASSAMFALYHGDFLQFGHSFLCGIILGYITFRYALRYSIILHCMHNFFVVVIALIDIPWFISYPFFAIFTIWGIIILISKKDKLLRYKRNGASLKNAYSYFFTVPMIIIYTIICLMYAVMSINIGPLEASPPSYDMLVQVP